MKKLNKIMAAFASLALSAAVFTGCVTDNPDLESLVDLSSFYLRGNMNNWCNDALTDGSLTENTDGTFTITYTAKSNPDEFAIADATWATKYCNGTEVVVDGDFVELAAGGGNAKVTGQVPGNNYKMTIQPLSSSVKVKVELAGSNIPSLYVLDTTAGAVKMEYDGTQYKYTAKATSNTIKLPVWVGEKYLKGSYAFGADAAANLTIENAIATVDITGVTADKEYNVYITYDGKNATAKAELALPKVYLAGGEPFGWDLGKGTAVQANIVGETSWYYYTFEAKSASLDFKVALKDAWSDAYTNNDTEDGKNLTKLDNAPVSYEFANAKNARITGLTVGQKYTLLIDISSGKPSVSVITGEDILFAIGNDDFGGWNWNSCKTMTPTGAGEWEYEFEATKADAEFKFQTKFTGNWVDDAQLGADATLSLGGEYIDLVNEGGGTPSIKATLTVGSDYVLSVKKSGDKYQVKIAAK